MKKDKPIKFAERGKLQRNLSLFMVSCMLLISIPINVRADVPEGKTGYATDSDATKQDESTERDDAKRGTTKRGTTKATESDADQADALIEDEEVTFVAEMFLCVPDAESISSDMSDDEYLELLEQVMAAMNAYEDLSDEQQSMFRSLYSVAYQNVKGISDIFTGSVMGIDDTFENGDDSTSGVNLYLDTVKVNTKYSAGEGTVYWEPTMDAEIMTGGTLTLVDVTMDSESLGDATIRVPDNTTVELMGDNSISHAKSGYSIKCGVGAVLGDLTITGEGVLKTYGGTGIIGKSVTIEDTTVNVSFNKGTSGIISNGGDMIINDSTVSAISDGNGSGTGSGALLANNGGNIIIENSTVTAIDPSGTGIDVPVGSYSSTDSDVIAIGDPKGFLTSLCATDSVTIDGGTMVLVGDYNYDAPLILKNQATVYETGWYAAYSSVYVEDNDGLVYRYCTINNDGEVTAKGYGSACENTVITEDMDLGTIMELYASVPWKLTIADGVNVTGNIIVRRGFELVNNGVIEGSIGVATGGILSAKDGIFDISAATELTMMNLDSAASLTEISNLGKLTLPEGTTSDDMVALNITGDGEIIVPEGETPVNWYRQTYISDGVSRIAYTKQGEMPTAPALTKENAVLKWNPELAAATAHTIYQAEWISTDTTLSSVVINGVYGVISQDTVQITLPSGSAYPAAGSIRVTSQNADVVIDTPTSTDGGKTWTFTVTAEDGSTNTYTIIITIEPSHTSGSGSGSNSSGGESDDNSKTNSGGWVSVENESEKNWKYYDTNGTAVTNTWRTLEYNGTTATYHFDSNGYCSTGWLKEPDGTWFYFNPVSDGTLGAMQVGWLTDPQDGKRYYLDPATGKMALGRVQIDGQWYTFNSMRSGESGWKQDLVTGKWVYVRNENTPLGALITE